MALMSGTRFADKWARNLKNAGQDIRAGVDSVTVAPGEKAALKADKMLAGIQEAIRTGRWQDAVKSVTLADWKRMMIDKGIARIPAGVDGAQGKMAQMGEKLMQALGNIAQTIDKMPDNTYEERIQKMVKQAELMHKVRLK